MLCGNREFLFYLSKKSKIKHVPDPSGVRGRNSDNSLIEKKIGRRPSSELRDGLLKTYTWIETQTQNKVC